MRPRSRPRRLGRLLALGLATLLAATVPAARSLSDEVARSTAREDLERYVSACVEVRGFSGAVLVLRGDETLHRAGRGLADREHGVPNTPESRFRIGSITKQFTAAAVLRLQELGRLRVDEPIGRHLPEAPEAWGQITIHHLLTHTSGIPSFTGFPDYTETMALESPPEKTIRRFRDLPLEFEPGTRFSYSNSGYVVLGRLIEHVSGTDYETFLRAEVFRGVELPATVYGWGDRVIPDRARGYDRRGEDVVNAAMIHMSVPHAAGALLSTVDDLSAWSRALVRGQVLSDESRRALFEPFLSGYAYGWVVGEREGRRVVGHGGGINGFVSALDIYPDDDLYVVVLGNSGDSKSPAMARDLAAIVLGLDWELPRRVVAVEVPSARLDALAGTYRRGAFAIVVRHEDGGLSFQGTAQPKLRGVAVSETEFVVEAVDARLEFLSAEGGVEGLELRQGGARLRFERVREPSDDAASSEGSREAEEESEDR